MRVAGSTLEHMAEVADRLWREKIAARPKGCVRVCFWRWLPALSSRIDAGGKRQVLAAFDAVREWQFKNARKANSSSLSSVMAVYILAG